MHYSARLNAAAAAAVLAIAMAFASIAHADSIAYVKDGNVFLSTSDGSRQYQVTTAGGYSDVSQADDGTMIALHGVRLHRLDRAGNVTADFDTPVSDTRPIGQKAFWGPYDPAISPGGDKVAYTYYYVSNGGAPGCYPPTCFVYSHEGGTGYSYADRQTAWSDPPGRHSGWVHPSWIDNDTTMLTDPTHLPNNDVIVDTVGDGTQVLKDWFTDTATTHIRSGEMTRQRTKMAFVAGDGDSELRVYRVRTFPTSFPPPDGSDQYPEACYHVTDPVGGSFGTPTFSPDGRRLAVAEGDGVHIGEVPDFAAGCTTTGATLPALVIAGASEPDWGPADVPPARPAGTGSSKPGGDPGKPGVGSSKPGTGSTSSATTSSKLTVTVPPARLRAALRSGLKLRVTVPGSGKLSASVRRGGRTLGTAAARTVNGPGTVTLTVRLGASARRALAHSKQAKVTVTVRFTAARGTGSQAGASATLR